MPGTTTLSQLEDNIEAIDVDLSDDALDSTEGTLEKIEGVGARYPEELEERTGR